MTTLSVPAPAKLNLFLHVLGRRADGYHDLQTVFQLLDHGDTLHFEASEDSAITLTPPLPGVAAENNLVLRAAGLLQAHSDHRFGAHIRLDKRLPLGGGIGGGSSDAATTLLALNQLWNLQLSLAELAELGLALGADVPVFVRGRSAWAEGVGERLQPLSLPARNYLILVPPCHVSTAQIFSHEALTRHTPAITIAAFLGQGGRNDCEPVVRMLHPEVAFALDWLAQFGPARMTGTGACVFTSFDDRHNAEQALQQVLRERPGGCTGFVASGVDHSPAHVALGIETGE